MRLHDAYLLTATIAALAAPASPSEDLLSGKNLLLTSTVMMHFADSALAKKEYERVKAFALAQSALNAKLKPEDTVKIAAFYAERLKLVAAAEAENRKLAQNSPLGYRGIGEGGGGAGHGGPGGIGYGGTMKRIDHFPPFSDTALRKNGVGARGTGGIGHGGTIRPVLHLPPAPDSAQRSNGVGP